MDNNQKQEPDPELRKIYPHFTNEELIIAEDNLERYLEIVLRIYNRTNPNHLTLEFPCRFAQRGAKHRGKFFFKFTLVDLRGIEPRLQQCECCVMPFYYRPVKSYNYRNNPEKIKNRQIVINFGK